MNIFDQAYIDEDLMVSDIIKEHRLITCNQCHNCVDNICKENSTTIGILSAYTFKTCPLEKW